MHIKSIVAGAAFAIAAATSPASAGDEFSTLGGVPAESLSSVEMAAVVGSHIVLTINPPTGGGGSEVELFSDATPDQHPLPPIDGFGRAFLGSDGVIRLAPHCPPDCGAGSGF